MDDALDGDDGSMGARSRNLEKKIVLNDTKKAYQEV